MSYTKKIWKNRQSQYPSRRLLNPTGTANEYDVVRAEGSISQEGDKFDADTMNDLEKRISDGINKCVQKNTSVTKIITLLSSGWNSTDKTYTINDPLITATSIQECDFDPNATTENDDIVSSAKLTDGGQGDGWVKLKAKGDIPTVDVTIRVIFMGEI